MSWLDPPEPEEYPPCPSYGSTDYEEVFISDKWIGCSCCMYHEDAEEYWQMRWEEEEINRKANLEDMLYDLRREEQLEEL